MVLSGGFPGSGGSVKNPRVDPKEGTVLEVRDFPRKLAEEVKANGWYANVSGTAVEIVDEAISTPSVSISDMNDAAAEEKSKAISAIHVLMATHGITIADLSE